MKIGDDASAIAFPCDPTVSYSVDNAINIAATTRAVGATTRQPNRNTFRCVGALAVVLAAVLCVGTAAAQNPATTGPLASAERIVLPASGVAPAGFRIEVMHERLDQFGDLPMRVLVIPTGTAFAESRELTLRVTFDPKTVTPSGFAANYQFSIKVAAGDSLVDQTVHLPKWFMRGDMRLTVLESGQPLAGYSANQAARGFEFSAGPYNSDWLESLWMDSAVARFGWIATPGSKSLMSVSQGSELDDVRVLLLSLVPELGTAQDVTVEANLPSILKTYGEMAGIRYRTVEELPDQWQGLRQSHVWITRWSTWESIEKNQPSVALAMRQYIRCGGALWILDAPATQTVADRFNLRLRQQPKVQRDDLPVEPFGESRAFDRLSSGVTAALEQATRGTKKQALFFPLPDFNEIVSRQYDNSPLHLHQGLIALMQTRKDSGNAFWQNNAMFLESNLGDDVLPSEINSIEVGSGIIVCCSHNESVPGSYFQWLQMQEETGTRLSNVINYGIDPIVGDGRFWNWSIPGVAQPPVYTFIGLLFLFVILVGPLAYRKLTQLGRGYLMFFVAPVLAAATTLILFLYGVIADGLGTQARIRQVTWLCEQDGGAVQYWRSTYFAGFRPSDGLAFPPSTHVVPYRENEYSNWYMMNAGDDSTQGTITLSDQGTRLSSGFFPSRQQRQFVGYRPLEKAGGLSFSVDSETDVATISSRFGYDLREVVVCDSAGAHWLCDNLAAGATQRAIPMEATEWAAKLSDLYMRQMPVSPPGIVRGGRRGNTRLDLVASLALSRPFLNFPLMTRATTGESQIDWWLRETLQTGSALPPLMFIAVADVSEECIANPGARLVESIHYVVGDVQ